MRVYVAGPMRNLPNNNFNTFYKAEAILNMWGYDVDNPARMDMDGGQAEWNWNESKVIVDNLFTIEDAMRRDFLAILAEDEEGEQIKAVFVLPGWQTSWGALRETWNAITVGLPLFNFDENAPVNIENALPIPKEDHPWWPLLVTFNNGSAITPEAK